MFGGYFPIVLDGVESVFAGTSVAAPLMAGVIARLNEIAISRAGTTLGYAHALTLPSLRLLPTRLSHADCAVVCCPLSV